jgi:TonB family protein
MRRRKILRLLVLLLPFVALRMEAQAVDSTPPPKSADEMKTLLADVFKQDTFAYLPGPYHLLATFETFTPDGQPDGEGSIEKFFSAPGKLKVITHFRGRTMTIYYVDAKPQYTDDGFDGTIMTYLTNQFLLLPLPPPTGTARRDMETKVMQLQGSTMDCGTYQFFMDRPPFPLPPKEVLCVSRDTKDLVMTQTLHFSVRYKDFAPFLDRSIPHTIVASQGPTVRCRIHVQAVDQVSLDDSALAPPPDASLAEPGPDWISTSDKESTPVRRVNPSYPSDMQAARISGPVTLLILISKTGKVKDVELQSAPSLSLAAAAIDSAKQWTYAPIVRHDKPVETIMTIHFNFAFNK